MTALQIGPADLLDGLDDPRVRLLRAPCHHGRAACINLGLSAAHGEYVARQDADDVSAPSRLERQVGFLEDHMEIVMVGSAGWLVDAGCEAPRPYSGTHKPFGHPLGVALRHRR